MLRPQRLKTLEVTKGQEFSPLVTDNFIMLMNAGESEKGKTYEVVFKAEPVNSPAARKPPAGEATAPAADSGKNDPQHEKKADGAPSPPPWAGTAWCCSVSARQGNVFRRASLPATEQR